MLLQVSILISVYLTATAIAGPVPSRYLPGQVNSAHGRVLTKTYTYDSTKDIDDPCNPVTGDPQRCLRSMEELAPTYNPPTLESPIVNQELAVAQSVAQDSDSDFDFIYSRGPQKSAGYYYPPPSL